eukprot:m.353931 g.353931  ORF g.353931 m.353931 type:complete len:93 (+) comp16867_c0_seq1:150-428(+)
MISWTRTQCLADSAVNRVLSCGSSKQSPSSKTPVAWGGRGQQLVPSLLHHRPTLQNGPKLHRCSCDGTSSCGQDSTLAFAFLLHQQEDGDEP